MNLFRKKEVVKPVKIVFIQKGGIITDYKFPVKEYENLTISFPQGREAKQVYIFFEDEER